MGRRLQVGVLGCGFQGRYHAANVATHSRAELAVCCDVDQALASSVAAHHGARSTADYQSVLRDPAIDALVIATTTNTHAELAIAAAREGKHVLLEKPMALNVADGLAIEAAAAEAETTLMIGFKFRFMRATIAARRAVPEPVVLSAHTLYDFTQDTSSWVNDRRLSGGRVLSSLVHSVDLLRFLAGSEVIAVSGAGGNLVIDDLDDLDNVVATLEFANGAVGSLLHGTAGESALLSVWSFQTAGRGVNATIYAHGRKVLIHDAAAGGPPTEVVDETADAFEAGTAELLDAFFTAIDSGRVDSATGRDGIMALVISRAIEAAIETGMRQSVKPPKQHSG